MKQCNRQAFFITLAYVDHELADYFIHFTVTMHNNAIEFYNLLKKIVCNAL